MNALKRRLLGTHRDFEAVQTLQSVFLSIHGDVLVGNVEMQKGLEALFEVQKKEPQKALDLISSSLLWDSCAMFSNSCFKVPRRNLLDIHGQKL